MKKLFVLVSFVVAASMLLAGCGAATPTAAMPEPATAAPAMPAATAAPAATTAPTAAAPAGVRLQSSSRLVTLATGRTCRREL